MSRLHLSAKAISAERLGDSSALTTIAFPRNWYLGFGVRHAPDKMSLDHVRGSVPKAARRRHERNLTPRGECAFAF